jgi:hypothetical protein
MIWDILDDGSKLYIINLLINSGFTGECKLISKVVGNTTIMEIKDETGKVMELPINILDILNN